MTALNKTWKSWKSAPSESHDMGCLAKWKGHCLEIEFARICDFAQSLTEWQYSLTQQLWWPCAYGLPKKWWPSERGSIIVCWNCLEYKVIWCHLIHFFKLFFHTLFSTFWYSIGGFSVFLALNLLFPAKLHVVAARLNSFLCLQGDKLENCLVSLLWKAGSSPHTSGCGHLQCRHGGLHSRIAVGESTLAA